MCVLSWSRWKLSVFSSVSTGLAEPFQSLVDFFTVGTYIPFDCKRHSSLTRHAPSAESEMYRLTSDKTANGLQRVSHFFLSSFFFIVLSSLAISEVTKKGKIFGRLNAWQRFEKKMRFFLLSFTPSQSSTHACVCEVNGRKKDWRERDKGGEREMG